MNKNLLRMLAKRKIGFVINEIRKKDKEYGDKLYEMYKTARDHLPHDPDKYTEQRDIIIDMIKSYL